MGRCCHINGKWKVSYAFCRWIAGETSPTSGALILGGIDGDCRLDFGTVTAGTMTVGCPFQATAANKRRRYKYQGVLHRRVPALRLKRHRRIAMPTIVALCNVGQHQRGNGTSAGTYQQLGSRSLTTGTGLVARGVASQNKHAFKCGTQLRICIRLPSSASTYTLEDSTTDGASYCVTSSTNSFAGGPGFGETTSSGLLLNTLGRAQGKRHVLVPNNSTFAVEG